MNAIIVADDSKIIQDIIEKALIGENILVLKAYDGYGVIDLLKNYSYNVTGILLDLKMPKYDGFTVLDFFKENDLFKKIPVSIISGDDSKETINRAFKYDITDMLNKPFTKENLDSYLKELAKEFRKKNGTSIANNK